jgi:hypothetical protein
MGDIEIWERYRKIDRERQREIERVRKRWRDREI